MPARYQLLSGLIQVQGLLLRPAQSTLRTYATTAPPPVVKNPLQRRRGGDLGSHLPQNVIPKDAYIPAYPYGDHQLFKQANKGLYGEQMIRFGNNVSNDTETKTRRNWKPNVLSKSLYSVALKKRIKLRVTAKVLKTIDREGGLDEYLLKDNPARIKELGPMGWALRWTLMQKPQVIDRLRADAAALGLDQATIDKQWPTPQMMAEQRAAQGTLAREMHSGAPEHLEFAETEGQEIWPGEEGEEPASISDSAILSRKEKTIKAFAATEYIKVVKAAERYLSRGVVDSIEEGLKLAFVRAKERKDAAALLKHKFNQKIEEAGFTAEDLQEIRTRFNLPNIKDHTARRIAYNQRKRKMIDEAGGIEAWNAAKSAEHAARIAEAGVQQVSLAERKAEYAALIAEAETASANEAMDADRRRRLKRAIEKADRAIKARAGSGQDDYVESAVEEFRNRRRDGLSEIYQDSQQEKNDGGDAWGALVNSSNKPTEQPAARGVEVV